MSVRTTGGSWAIAAATAIALAWLVHPVVATAQTDPNASASDGGASIAADAPAPTPVAPAQPSPTHRASRPATTSPPAESSAVVHAEPLADRSAGQLTLPVGLLSQRPRVDPTEILAMVPGVSLTNEATTGDAPEIYMRGFFSDNGRDVGLSVEGIPLNDESNTLTHGYADLLFLIPEVVQQLNVVEGLSDPRQGNFALAGSIDFGLGLTQRGLTLRASYGTQGYYRLGAFYGPESKSRDTFVATDFTHADGFGPRRAFDRWSLVAQHVFDLGNGWRARLLGIGYAARWQIPGFVRQDDCPPGSCPDSTFFGVYPNTGNQSGYSTRVLASLGLEWQGTLARAVVRFYGQVRDFRETENADGFFNDPVHGDLLSERYTGATLGLNGYYRRAVRVHGLLQELELGFSVRHDRYELNELNLSVLTNAVQTPPSTDDNSATIHVTNPAAYLDATVRPLTWLMVRGGVRLDAMAYDLDTTAFDMTANGVLTAHANAFGLHAGPKATLAIGPLRGFEVLASYGTGFRSPEARTVQDSAPVEFTTAATEDLSFRYTLPARAGGPRFIAALTGFHTTVDHDEVFDPTVGDEVPVGATDRLGAMLWGRVQPVPWIDVAASVTYTHATVEQDSLSGNLVAGSALPYQPSLVARLDGGVDREVARFRTVPVRVRGNLGASYRGAEPLILAGPTAPTFLLDASAGVRVGPVAFDIAGRNLTDARWHAENFEYASNFNQGTPNNPMPVQHFAAGAPLTVIATLSFYFGR